MPSHPYLHLKRFSVPAISASLRQPRPALSRSLQSRATTSSPSELMGMLQSPIPSQPCRLLPGDVEGTSHQRVTGTCTPLDTAGHKVAREGEHQHEFASVGSPQKGFGHPGKVLGASWAALLDPATSSQPGRTQVPPPRPEDKSRDSGTGDPAHPPASGKESGPR